MSLPDIQVEIAFDSGWSTPAADRTWTDVSQYVEVHDGVSIGVGRGDEFASADANGLTLTLDNTDGRFTPELSTSPYYPNVKVGRPIRVTVTPSGESPSIRFVGYVDAWPVTWGGSDGFVRVQLSATSRIARLGSAQQLRSLIEIEYLRDRPTGYYTFGEGDGATTAADSSGNSLPSLVVRGDGAAVSFGNATGPGTDDLTAVTFAGGKYLAATVNEPVTAATGYWCEFFINTEDTDSQVAGLRDATGATADAARFFVDSGTLQVQIGGSLKVGPVINDGATHQVLALLTSTDLQVWVDGVLEVDDPSVYTQSLTINQIDVGRAEDSSPGTPYFTGTLAHFAFGSGEMAPARIVAHANAGLSGFQGESPADRLERYASYAGVLPAEIDADTGTPPMSHADTTGQTALDMMRKVEVTEGGVLFDAPDGTLTFRDRSSRYQATSQFTISAADQELESDYAPTFDLANLANNVTAQLLDESATATAVDQDSVDEYGPRGETLELMTTDPNEAHAAAWWRVGNYAEPASRVPTLSLSLSPFSAADQESILGLTVGSLVTVTGLPDQAPNATEDYFVEGYMESITPEEYRLTFNVSPAALYLTTWVLDSATRSQLGTTTRLAY